MRSWTYSYMTSDGLRHEGEMSAPSKDDVYSELRKRGIRAIKVQERIQPVVKRGFGGLRKRDWTVIAAIAALIAAAVALFARGHAAQHIAHPARLDAFSVAIDEQRGLAVLARIDDPLDLAETDEVERVWAAKGYLVKSV